MGQKRKIVNSIIVCIVYLIVSITILLVGIRFTTSEYTGEYEAKANGYSKGNKYTLTYEVSKLNWFDVLTFGQIESSVYAITSNGEHVLVNKLDYLDVHYLEQRATSFYVSEEQCTKVFPLGLAILGGYLLLVIGVGEWLFVRRAKHVFITEREKTDAFLRSFYEKCYSLNITDITADGALEKAMLVGKSFNLETEKKVKQTFILGQEKAKEADDALKEQALREKQQKQEQEQEALRQLRQEVKDSYAFEKQQASITGKQKYLNIIRDMCGGIDYESASLSNFNAMDAFQHHKADNWGWAGGIASGIAGPAAGVVAAMESHEKTMQHNAAVDRFNSNLIASGYDPLELNDKRDKKLASLAKKKETLQAHYKAIDTAVVDDNAQQYFDNLEFEITASYLKDSGYLSLNVAVTQTKPVTILDAPACLDGSVVISVLDSQNNVVGEAYYNAGNNRKYKPSEAGFAHSKARKVTAIPLNAACFDANETYHFTVSPASMWAIECVV